jgi:hypothetical protein
VKSITVTVPDEVYRQARIRAAERGTSVSALAGIRDDRTPQPRRLLAVQSLDAGPSLAHQRIVHHIR